MRELAVKNSRGTAIEPLRVNVPLAGSYKSAVAAAVPVPLSPPISRTLPVGKSTALKLVRATLIDPEAAVNDCPNGS